jgi:hypothetical protein
MSFEHFSSRYNSNEIINFYADPVFSFTIAFNDLMRLKIIVPATKAAIVIIKKKIVLSVKSFQKLAKIPAAFPPSDVERYHPPIISAVVLAGDNFDTSDKPIGLRNNSLTVKIP